MFYPSLKAIAATLPVLFYSIGLDTGKVGQGQEWITCLSKFSPLCRWTKVRVCLHSVPQLLSAPNIPLGELGFFQVPMLLEIYDVIKYLRPQQSFWLASIVPSLSIAESPEFRYERSGSRKRWQC
jgi:hypothetical protein